MLSELTSFSKLPANIILIIALISSLLLFTDNNFLEKLALLEFKNEYNKYIGIIFLFTVSITFINILKYSYKSIKIKYKKYSEKEKVKQTLNNLDEQEKAILREFYVQNKNAITASYQDASVKNLINTGVLESSSQITTIKRLGDIIDIKRSQITLEYLNNTLIDYPDNKRPYWIRNFNNYHKLNQDHEKLTQELLKSLRNDI